MIFVVSENKEQKLRVEETIDRNHVDNLFQTEYKYCYDLVLHYVLHYLNKDMNEKK